MSVSVYVSDRKSSPGKVLSEFEVDSSHGAQASLFGLVRNHHEQRKVKSVSYQLFEPLVEKTFHQIGLEAKQRWGDELKVLISHWHGKLEVGEMSVAIVVSSPHRAEAFEACRYMIEQIKVRAPIWKKEHYVDGESEWVQGHALCRE